MEQAIVKNMAHMAYGIYVLTTRFEDIINGMIVSWVTQVSYEPPLVQVAVHPNRYTHDLLMKSRHFALHILDNTQKAFVNRFMGPNSQTKFENISWNDGITGCPVLSDCIGAMECRIIEHLTPGNHSLFIGEVVSAIFNKKKAPLCTSDYEGRYLGKV